MIDPQGPDFSDTPAASSRPVYAYRPREGRVEPPHVSIVTVFDDAAGVVRETARSVLGQSFQRWEWLIVNDASLEAGALAALRPYRDLDPRIRVMDLPVRSGRGAARNAGCRAARAPYVYILDAGDLIEPTTLEKCLWHLVTHPELAFTSGWSVRLGAPPSLYCRGYEEHEKFLDENLASGAFLVRRSAHEQVGGFDETLGPGLGDWDYWLRHADQGLWGSTIPEYLSWHRRRAEHAEDSDPRFRGSRQERYPRIFGGGFPRIRRRTVSPYETVGADPALDNPLEKPAGVRRVLLIFPRLIVGGADKFTIDLVGQLAARDHDVTVCTTLDDDNPWLAGVTRVTPDVFRLATFLRLPDYPRFLLYLIDSRRIDVVIVSHCYLGYQLLPFLRAYRPEVACVDYSHIEAEHWNNGGYPRAAVGCQELTDLTLVSTRHLKEWMVERGAQAARIEVVHTNIDTDVWKPDAVVAAAVRAELGFSPELPLILYAGRLSARKQPHVFAEVIRRLAGDQRLAFACLVAGEGDELPALRRFLADHGLEARVRLLGWVSTERMRELQAAADIFFLPSRLEGLSLALFEAMAMETVPVSAHVGGHDELVAADCGFLVPPGDGEIDRYVEALRRLIESGPLRSAMAAAARRRVVESFRIEEMGERMCEALSRAEKLCLTESRPAVSRGLGLESATLAVEHARQESSYAYHLACANDELAARVDDLHRQLTSAHLEVQRPAEGEAVKRLSAHEISRHIGARKIFKSLCLRLAWRSRLPTGLRSGAGGGERIPPGDGAEPPHRLVRHLAGVPGGPGGDPLDALEKKLRESEGRAESAQARLDELRRTVDDRDRLILAMTRTRVWRAAQTWWSMKHAAVQVVKRMTPGFGVVDASARGRAAMRYDVTIYCPDRHIVYDGRTPDRQGVGGGLTARVRLARALASLGHRVTVVANCPREGSYDGVRYVPLEQAKRIRTDVLVLNTSGGGLDLRPIHDVDVQARCRIVWVQGMPAPQALHEVALDFLCAPSNFIRRVAQQEWGVPPSATFVAYNAADAARSPRWSPRPVPARDPHRLVYTSHPDKGLDAAIGVLRLLRRRDARYHLHVYGSARLSGQEESAPPVEDGLTYHGVVGQVYLARALLHAGVSLNLQARQEPMPLAALEAMRAGCIVLASPVGGYPEIVWQGRNGFLVPGDHRDEATWRHAADLVSHLIAEPAHARYLRHHARNVPWDWTTMAWTWCGLWDWALAKTPSPPHTIAAVDLSCGECGGTYLALADGYHCTACGFYSR